MTRPDFKGQDGMVGRRRLSSHETIEPAKPMRHIVIYDQLRDGSYVQRDGIPLCGARLPHVGYDDMGPVGWNDCIVCAEMNRNSPLPSWEDVFGF